MINKVEELINEVCIVITDLDRAKKGTSFNKGEKGKLIGLIKTLEIKNKKNNIFLTYENIERFFVGTIPNAKKGDELEKHIKDYKKGDHKILEKLKKCNSNIENAKTYFNIEDLFYHKEDFNKVKPNENNIAKKQSSLVYFVQYIEKISNDI